jgi:hypothetical protein
MKPQKAYAAEAVKDLRPLRGALSRVLDRFPRFGSASIMGAAAPMVFSRTRSN